MKICLINPFSKFAAVRQYNLAKALALMGNEVTLVLPKFDQYSGYKPMKFEEIRNLTIMHPRQLSSRKIEFSFLFYVPSMIKRTKKLDFDIVHAFRPTPFSAYPGYKIAKKKDIPFILELGDLEWKTMRNLGIHPGYRVKIVKHIEETLSKKADAMTVMTPKVEDYVHETYKVKCPVLVLSNGVDTSLFRPSREPVLEKQLKKKLNARYILMYVGKLDNISHIMDLIKLMAKLKSDFGLVIIGDGARRKKLEDNAAKNNVSKKIFFAGSMENEQIPRYMNAADILVAPFAKTEGIEYASNLKLFEYMAVGKPIIASSVGMIPAILKDCGYVYAPGDIDALVKHINYISLDMKKAQEFGKSARLKAVKQYDWRVLAKELSAFYKKVIFDKNNR